MLPKNGLIDFIHLITKYIYIIYIISGLKMEGRTVNLVKKQSEEEKTPKLNSSNSATSQLPPMRILTVSSEGAVFYRLDEGAGAASLVVDADFP